MLDTLHRLSCAAKI